MRISTRMAAYILVGLSLCVPQSTYAQQKEEARQPISDRYFYFTAAIPPNWSVQHAQEASGVLRLKAFSPDKSQAVLVYAISAKEKIELDKVVALDRKLGWELGPLIKEERLGLIYTSAVERAYGPSPKGLHARARFQVDATYGYVILALSKTPNVSFSRQIFDSFSTGVPFAANLRNWWKGFTVLGWVGSILAGLVIVLILFLLGITGSLVRNGVETKKALRKAAVKAETEGLALSTTWYEYSRKSTVHIIVPILGWITGYGLLLYVLPIKLFILCLFLLVPPILGYFGIFFSPSENLEDYLP